MKNLFDSAWRAAAYCLHPKVILLSLLPLVLIASLAFGLSYLYWETALDNVRLAFENWDLLNSLFGWLEGMGAKGLKAVLAPLVVVFLATPVLVVLSLLAVSLLMAPVMLRLVAKRRFPALERRQGGSFSGSLFTGLGATAIALVVLVVSIPLWLVPMVVLIVPPLIWGWLTYRVMSYDTLAEHADRAERLELMRRHRARLLAMGVITGYLGAAPSVLWASGAVFIFLAPVLIPVAIWIYTLVFAFSALWFAHFLLSELQAMRRTSPPAVLEPAPQADTALTLPPA